MPRPGGVKKGWNRAYAFVCDFKVFLHDPSQDIHSPANATTYIFEIRCERRGRKREGREKEQEREKEREREREREREERWKE